MCLYTIVYISLVLTYLPTTLIHAQSTLVTNTTVVYISALVCLLPCIYVHTIRLSQNHVQSYQSHPELPVTSGTTGHFRNYKPRAKITSRTTNPFRDYQSRPNSLPELPILSNHGQRPLPELPILSKTTNHGQKTMTKTTCLIFSPNYIHAHLLLTRAAAATSSKTPNLGNRHICHINPVIQSPCVASLPYQGADLSAFKC